MSGEIIVKKSLDFNKDEFFGKFKGSLRKYFAEEDLRLWDIPLLLNNDLPDFMLIDEAGKLFVVKILFEKINDYSLENLLFDYTNMLDILPKLASVCKDISNKNEIAVKLFLPDRIKEKTSLFRYLTIPCDIYLYEVLDINGEEKLIVERLKSFEKTSKHKKDHLESFFKIIGENVRSKDFKSVNKEVDTDDKKNITEEKDNKVIHLIYEEKQQSNSVNTSNNKHNNLLAGQIDFDNMQLSDEELIAFFDLEKKIDNFYNIKAQE